MAERRDERDRLADVLRAAGRRLAEAGSESPQAEAELLAGHLLGLSPGALRAAALRGDPAPDGLDDLLAARLAGAPVQHLIGLAAFRRLELAVGPGVFIPRPETELVVQAALDECLRLLAGAGDPSTARELIAVDLCTGSGAIAAALAADLPAEVNLCAVEIDPAAAGFARRNLPERVRLVVGDATAPQVLADLNAQVDVVVSNPPYVPDGSAVSALVARDPHQAIFGGVTGYELPLAVALRARSLLRPGGLLVLEHHDRGQAAFVGRLTEAGFVHVSGHRDLSDRQRFVTARLPTADVRVPGAGRVHGLAD